MHNKEVFFKIVVSRIKNIRSRIQSLHVLFTLYSAFTNSQHFNQLARYQKSNLCFWFPNYFDIFVTCKMCLFFSMFFFNIFVIHISHTYREGESSADVLTLPEWSISLSPLWSKIIYIWWAVDGLVWKIQHKPLNFGFLGSEFSIRQVTTPVLQSTTSHINLYHYFHERKI